jgi:hypothetical protein
MLIVGSETSSVFNILVAFMVVVWKELFYKKYFWLGWFGIYICSVKTVVEIEVV